MLWGVGFADAPAAPPDLHQLPSAPPDLHQLPSAPLDLHQLPPLRRAGIARPLAPPKGELASEARLRGRRQLQVWNMFRD